MDFNIQPPSNSADTQGIENTQKLADPRAQQVEEQLAQVMQVAQANSVPAIEDAEPLKVYVPEGGSEINMYDEQEDPSDPQGYMILEQEVLVVAGAIDAQDPMTILRGNRVKTERKSAIKSGKVADLQKELKLLKGGKFKNARIQIVEYLESDAQGIKEAMGPEAFEKRIKRAGSDDSAPDVTKNGERIVRLSVVDYLGSTHDVRQEHDNIAELREFAAIRREERLEAQKGFAEAEAN